MTGEIKERRSGSGSSVNPVFAQASSLWELHSLEHHYHPSVAKSPAVLRTPYLNRPEIDVARTALLSYTSMFDRDLAWEPRMLCP